jgi:hypothetical protein
MDQIKTLTDLYPDYPPPPAVWDEIKHLVNPPTQQEADLKMIQKAMGFLRHEISYKDKTKSTIGLPEPQVLKFYIGQKAYFIDLKLNVYRPNINTQNTGTLCGHLNPETQELIIDNKSVHKFEKITARGSTVHEQKYYLDTDDPKHTTYRAFLPHENVNLIYAIGTQPKPGKLQIYEAIPRPSYIKEDKDKE